MKILLRTGLALISLTSAAFAGWVAFNGSQPIGAARDDPNSRTSAPSTSLGTDPALFVTDAGGRLTYEGLRHIIIPRAVKADVEPPTLHSFHRIFSLEYLRAGGDIFTLQKLMGHADLQILRRYLNLLDEDLERGHRQFGPVDRMEG